MRRQGAVGTVAHRVAVPPSGEHLPLSPAAAATQECELGVV